MAVRMVGGALEAATVEDVMILMQAQKRMEAEGATGGAQQDATGPRAEAHRPAGTAPKGAPKAPPAAAQNPKKGWSDFIGFLNDNQLRTLRIIKAKDGITLDELSAALGNPGNSNNPTSGYMSNIQKNAKRCLIDPDLIYRRAESGSGKARVVRYSVGTLLVANEVPDAPTA